MKKILFFAMVGIAFSVTAAGLKYSKTVETPVWRIPRPGKKLARVRIFAERQTYKPNQTYLHHFIDRPLFNDVSKREEGLEKSGFLHDVNIINKCGFDGFGTIHYNSLFKDHLKYLKGNAPAGYQHALVLGGDPANPSVYNEWRERLRIAAGSKELMSLVDGRIICVFYGSASPQLLENVIAGVKKLRADPTVPPFVFISELPFISMYVAFNEALQKGEAVPPQEIDKFRKQLREHLKTIDGMILRCFENYTQSICKGYGCRIQPTDLYDKYLLPVLQEEFAKPEHKDKLVLLFPRHGYTNHLRGVVHYECGTEALRTYLGGGAKLAPDILMLFEWNEANENTHFQPTVANGRSIERMLHYAKSCYEDRDPEPRPGDDVTVPNMILSIPQVTRPGETLHAELLNLPDTVKSSKITAVLSLFDGKGNKIADLPAENFDRKEFKVITWAFPSEQFAAYQAVNYQLTLTENGKTTVYRNFDVTRIAPTVNLRYKFTRMALREMLKPEKSDFDVKLNADGTYSVKADFVSPEELASLEVIDCHSEMYAVDRSKEFEDRVFIRGFYSALASNVNIPGWYSMPGINDWKIRAIQFNYENFNSGLRIGERQRVKHRFTCYGRGNFIISFPKSELAKNPVLHMNYQGMPEVTVNIKDVLEKGKTAVSVGGNIRFEFHRPDKLVDHPVHINAKQASIDTVIHPVEKFPVVQLRAVSKSGKIYRSPAIVLKDAGKEQETMRIWSETELKPVTISIAKSRIPDIRMKFDPELGLFAGHTDAPVWEIALGGGTAGGQPFCEPPLPVMVKQKLFPEKFSDNFPEWKQDNGQWILDFDGEADYMIFSQDLIPRGVPFIVEFEIRRATGGNDVLLRTGCQSWRNNCGLDLMIENGKLKGFYNQHFHRYTSVFATGLDVPVGKWTKIRIIKNVDKITFEVDGKSESFDYTGRGSFFCMTVFGGTPYPDKKGKYPQNLQFFKGQMRSFSVRHNDME